MLPVGARADGPMLSRYSGTPTPSPTLTPTAPAADVIGEDLVELFRITTAEIFAAGGMSEYLVSEPDELVLARIAIAENPHSLGDQIFVMWNIRLRAELGFKDAGKFSGWRAFDDRWAPPTSIKREALCFGGCQYEPARSASRIYFPNLIPESSNLKPMLFPLDEQIPDFYFAYLAAKIVVAADFPEDYPEELRGFDGFRGPSVSWIGRIDYPGGIPSAQFYRGGEIWRDEYPRDNEFFRKIEAGEEISLLPTSTPTNIPEPSSTRTPTPTPIPIEETDIPDPIVDPISIEENTERSKTMKIKVHPLIALLFVAVLSFALMAFQVIDESRIEEIIAGLIGFVVMLFGPKPLKWIYDLLKIPGGAWRVVATYVMSGLVGFVVMLIAGAFVDIVFDAETILVLAGALATAAQMAYHRLKDLYGSSLTA